MDTKLKKFKYKPLKAVAFLLCLTLVGVGALSTCRLADFAYRSGFYFGSNSGIADAANNFYDARLSKAFLDEVGFVYYAAKRVFITYRNGEVFQDGSLENELEQAYATYSQENAAEQFQKARSVAEEFNKFYRRLPSETELIAADGYEDRDGDGTRRDDVRDENGRCLNDFENSDQYLVKTNRVTVNTRYFSALVDRSRAADIPGEVAAARAEYEYLTQYLQSLSAVKYLILNDKTGEAFTNSPTMSAYQFNELYGASDWCVSSTDNFETATVSEEFSALCSRMEADDKGAGDVFTINGAEVNGGAYTRQFLESMRYGYESKTKTVSAVLGATVASRRLGGTPCTVYLSYNDSRVTAADPFDALNKDFLASANRFSKSMATLLLSLFISAALTALLCLLTGRDDKNSPIRMRRFDRFPSDLRLVLAAGLCIGLLLLGVTSLIVGLKNPAYSVLSTVGFVICCVCADAVLLDYLMFLSRSIKNNSLFSHMVIAFPFRFTQRVVNRLTGNNSALPDGMKRQFKVAAPFYAGATAGSLLLLLLAAAQHRFFAIFLLLLLFGSIQLAFITLLYSYAKSLDKIRDTVQATQSGDFDMQFDTDKMPRSMVNFAENISEMRQDMKDAMQAAVQDQRTKTELITNVTHDLKTPLTSIITYTELIKNSNVQEEAVRDYAAVLSEKSLRLKQLIDDLTEASKLSGGNVEIHPMPVSLYELAVQAIAENEDSLEAAGIEILMTPGEERPIVMADGQKTYRVFENILSNIAKYAKRGSQAFVSVREDDGYGVITFVNTCAVKPDLPAERLMERFVRGDSSRVGEGSGLGLSITKDLCRLQGGQFKIALEEDKFRAMVRLPLAGDEDL